MACKPRRGQEYLCNWDGIATHGINYFCVLHHVLAELYTMFIIQGF